MTQNYYTVLGVAPGASPDMIREAYRRLARDTHPDVSGCDSKAEFQAVQEAWETLGDDQRREAYDALLQQEQDHSPRRIKRTRSPNTFKSAGFGDWPDQQGDFHFGLQMTQHEARTGGEMFVRVPVRGRCASCAGTGRHGSYVCGACKAVGFQANWRTAELTIPPGLTNLDTLELALDAFGWPGGRLILHVEIHSR